MSDIAKTNNFLRTTIIPQKNLLDRVVAILHPAENVSGKSQKDLRSMSKIDEKQISPEIRFPKLLWRIRRMRLSQSG